MSHSDMRIASQNVRNSDELVQQVADDTEVVGIDEGQFFDAEPAGRVQHAGGSRQARDRRRPRSGLPRPSVRADAAAAGDCRVHHQDARDLRRLRRSGQPHAAARRRAATACWSARPVSTRRAAGTASIRISRRSKNVAQASRHQPQPSAMARQHSPWIRSLRSCCCSASAFCFRTPGWPTATSGS